MSNDQSRRKFLKYGFIGVAALFATTAPIKFSPSEKFAVGNLKMPQPDIAQAYARCGLSPLDCGGGGGECAAGLNCGGGGGGRCGISVSCSGS